MIPHSAGLVSSAPVHRLPKVFPPFDGHWHFKSNDAYKPFLTSGVISTPGTRGADRMEDSHFLADNLGDCSDLHVYGVFDGHGGSGASKYAETHFLRHLGQAWAAQGFKVKGLPEALRDAFVNLVRALHTAPQSTGIASHSNGIAQHSTETASHSTWTAPHSVCVCVCVPPHRMPSSSTPTRRTTAARRPSCVWWQAAT
jgi:hypothetical protein